MVEGLVFMEFLCTLKYYKYLINILWSKYLLDILWLKHLKDILWLKYLMDITYMFQGLVRGARYIFGLDGNRKFRLEELEDGQSYVAASDRKFIVSLSRKIF